MDVKQKFNLLTSHLMLEKEKHQVELERFINDNSLGVESMCEYLPQKLDNYRNSIKNLDIWLKFIEPVDKPENINKD